MSKKILLFSFLFFFILITYGLKPYIEKRSIKRVAIQSLSYWKTGDMSKIYPLWFEPKNIPPIYSLKKFIILETFFSKNNKKHFHIILTLDFPENNITESGKEWEMILVKKGYEWLILSLLRI